MPYRWYAQLDSDGLGILVYFARRHWVISRGARLRASYHSARTRLAGVDAGAQSPKAGVVEARKARVQNERLLGA